MYNAQAIQINYLSQDYKNDNFVKKPGDVGMWQNPYAINSFLESKGNNKVVFNQ